MVFESCINLAGARIAYALTDIMMMPSLSWAPTHSCDDVRSELDIFTHM